MNNSPTHEGSKESTSVGNWSQMFIQQGGLRHLFDIFMSGISCVYYGIMPSINYAVIVMVYSVCLKLRSVVVKFNDHRFPYFRIILKSITLNSVLASLSNISTCIHFVSDEVQDFC